jgi:hypothetical protein
MPLVNVPITDSFDIWRQKTNLISVQQGDLTLLLTIDQTSLVASLNEIYNLIQGNIKSVWVRSIYTN